MLLKRLTNQSTILNAKSWPRLPIYALLPTEPDGCYLQVTSLGKRAGSDSETVSLGVAIRNKLNFLEEQYDSGSRRIEDFNLVVGDVGLVLETTLKDSCRLSLAIEALKVLHTWVDVFGSRDVSTAISCHGITLAGLRIEFLKKGLEATCCLLPINLTTIR